MDKNSKEFIKYLLNIGILNNENSENFSNLLYSIRFTNRQKSTETNNDQNKTNIATDDLLIASLLKYIQSLSIENLSEMATGIYNKYASEKNEKITSNLYKLINIYIKSNIKFYLIYWKKLSHYLKHKDQIQKLYDDNKKIHPNLKTKGKSYSKINIKTNEFLKRQENFIKLRNFNRLKCYNNKENELKLLCTFNPKISKKINYNNTSNIPTVLTISNNFSPESYCNSRENNSSFINNSKNTKNGQKIYDCYNFYKIKKK